MLDESGHDTDLNFVSLCKFELTRKGEKTENFRKKKRKKIRISWYGDFSYVKLLLISKWILKLCFVKF